MRWRCFALRVLVDVRLSPIADSKSCISQRPRSADSGHQKQLYALAMRGYYRVPSWQSVRGVSFDADAYASPCDDNADRNLQSGQRAGAMPRIDPAAQRGCRGLKTDEARPDIGPLRSVHSSMAWGVMVQY